MSFQILIPAAGVGSRLFQETLYVNKALVQIDFKPIISHIIDKFPEDCQFIIPVGYKGSDLVDYIDIAHSDRDIIFETINPYEGPGSGLGFSMSQVMKYIDGPFVFSSCDTLVNGNIPKPDENWIGYSEINNPSDYRTIDIINDKAAALNEKLLSKSKNAYIGLAGILDFKQFKDIIEENEHEFLLKGESYPISKMIKKFKPLNYEWRDTGNVAGLNKTRKEFKDISKNKINILEKENEKIWFINNKVIKFSSDSKFIRNRIDRQKILKDFTPKIIDEKLHMYSYSYQDGEVLSNCLDLNNFKNLMKNLEYFWKKVSLNPNEYNLFVNSCTEFYKDKTFLRLEKFLSLYPYSDRELILNNKKIIGPYEILDTVNWELLSRGEPHNFHGDLHFENILISNNKFIFLDWRQDFNGLLEYGDIYYDLAKLLHGILLPHPIITKGKYRISESENEINIKIDLPKNNLKIYNSFKEWCNQNNYDFSKIYTLCGLIYINIAPLHHHPYSRFLFYYGIDMLSNKEEMLGN